MDVGRIAAEKTLHLPHRFPGDAQRRAAPSGMAGADGPADGIIEQHHIAVGGEHHQRQMGHIGHHAIHGGIVPVTPQTLACVGLRHVAHHILVDLLGQHHPVHVRAQHGAEAAVVLLYPCQLVAPAHAEVQTVPRRGGYAAGAGGKAVANAGQGIGGQVCDAVFGVGVEHSTSLKKRLSFRASARTGVGIRISLCGKKNGLPRRFAPRNDRKERGKAAVPAAARFGSYGVLALWGQE